MSRKFKYPHMVTFGRLNQVSGELDEGTVNFPFAQGPAMAMRQVIELAIKTRMLPATTNGVAGAIHCVNRMKTLKDSTLIPAATFRFEDLAPNGQTYRISAVSAWADLFWNELHVMLDDDQRKFALNGMRAWAAAYLEDAERLVKKMKSVGRLTEIHDTEDALGFIDFVTEMPVRAAIAGTAAPAKVACKRLRL